eukprot:scpid75243/ scgid19024/ 
MKACVVVLLAVAAVAIGKPTPDLKGQLAKLVSQQAKWSKILGGSAGYIMQTTIGNHFLPKDESSSQQLCSLPSKIVDAAAAEISQKKAKQLLGEDKASLPPQFQGKRKHLLGEDRASLPPQFQGKRKHLLGEDRASLPPQFQGKRKHLLGEDRASLPPQFQGPRKQHLLGQDEASRPRPLSGRKQRNRRSLNPAEVFGADQASLPPMAIGMSLPNSMSDIFALLRRVLTKGLCSLKVVYHKKLGHPTHVTMTGCKFLPQSMKAISIPKIVIVRQASKVGKVCAAPVAINHTARPIAHHFAMLARLTKANLTARGTPKLPIGFFGVGPVMFPNTDKKIAAGAKLIRPKKPQAAVPKKVATAVKSIFNSFQPGPVVLSKAASKKAVDARGLLKKIGAIHAVFAAARMPGKKMVSPRKPMADRSRGRMTGVNPAVFTDVSAQPADKPQHNMEHHGMEHHDMEQHNKEHHGEDQHHGEHRHGEHHHGEEHHGEQHQDQQGKTSRFIAYWRTKDQQFRHFIIKHPWALPTAFAGLGVLVSAVILLALQVRNRRRRNAALAQERHALMDEDKKVLIDEKPVSFYVNEICA